MVEFMREAGWPIFPVLILSLVGVGTCVRHALEPTRALRALGKGLVTASLCFGVFGAVVGFQVSVRAIEEAAPDLHWLVAVGAREALNNLTLPLAFGVLSLLALGIGSYRLASRRPA